MAESTDPLTATQTPKEHIKRFYSLQERIVETYHLFEEGFGVYLDRTPTVLYRQLVNAVKNTFEGIACEIMFINAELSYLHNRKELASLVGNVLDKEKCKLDLIVNLKLAERDVQNNKGVESYVDKVRELKKRLKEIEEEINEVLEKIKYESEDLYEDERAER